MINTSTFSLPHIQSFTTSRIEQMTTEEYAFFLAYGVTNDAELQMQELNEELYVIPKVQALDPYPVLVPNAA
jgi:hypothetical protein